MASALNFKRRNAYCEQNCERRSYMMKQKQLMLGPNGHRSVEIRFKDLKEEGTDLDVGHVVMTCLLHVGQLQLL